MNWLERARLEIQKSAKDCTANSAVRTQNGSNGSNGSSGPVPFSISETSKTGPWRLGLFTPGPIGDLPAALISELKQSGVRISHLDGRIWLTGSKAKPMDTELLRRVMDHLRSFNSPHPPSAA